MYEIFPMTVPMVNTTEFAEAQAEFSVIEPGAGRSSGIQGGYQMLALVITLVVAIIGGAVTGRLNDTIIVVYYNIGLL
jgi:ammonium transporter Rh